MAGFGVSRAFLDTAGGGVIMVGNPVFFVDGFPAAVVGNPVKDHGDDEHEDAEMVTGRPSFAVAGGMLVCTTVDSASCGHNPTGSSTFFIG